MSRQQPPLVRKSSTPWDRLKPIKQDPLETMGFVSKGDSRLLDPKAQESFYHKIVARYMQFCTQHSKGLEAAFASLSLDGTHSASSDPTRNPPVNPLLSQSSRAQSSPEPSAHEPTQTATTSSHGPLPANELSNILLALRKLREALLATVSNNTKSTTAQAHVTFSQRVHVFSIRLSILAYHPPSYFPSLTYILFTLHGAQGCFLPTSELHELTSYLILDLSLRQKELASAYSLRHQARTSFQYCDQNIDKILRAAVTNDWVLFWKVRRKVDGHVRALMYWQINGSLRKHALKAIGKSYMKCDLDWVLQSTSGGEMTWEELVAREDVGWIKDGNTVIIKKPKLRG